MMKLRDRSDHTDPHLRRLLLVGATLGIALVLASCPWDNGTDWSDYEGVNLIAGQGFGATEATTGTPWALTAGLTAATNQHGPGGVGVDYARWEPVDTTPPESAADAPVFRLETANLMRNGDFEDAPGGDGTPALWQESGAGTARAEIVGVATAISGTQSLSLDFQSIETRFRTDLTQSLLDGFPASVYDVGSPEEYPVYAIHIDFRLPAELTNFTLELNDDASQASILELWNIQRQDEDDNDTENGTAPDLATVVYSYPGADRETPATSDSPNLLARDPGVPDARYLSFGGMATVSRTRVEGVFDNLRVVRSGKAHYLRLPVPFRAPSRPEIVSGGSYRFSLWVKADPAAFDMDHAQAGNRFPARHIAAGIDPEPAGAGTTRVIDTSRQDLTEVNADRESWHQLTWELSGGAVTVPLGTQGDDVVFDLVLEIGHAAGGPRYQDAGSLLVAAPELTWSPR